MELKELKDRARLGVEAAKLAVRDAWDVTINTGIDLYDEAFQTRRGKLKAEIRHISHVKPETYGKLNRDQAIRDLNLQTRYGIELPDMIEHAKEFATRANERDRWAVNSQLILEADAVVRTRELTGVEKE